MKEKKNQCNPGYFRHLIENRSIRKKFTYISTRTCTTENYSKLDALK